MAARGRPPVRVPLLGSPRGRAIASFGGLLIGLSVYQGEFDFGVPQFRLAFHPMLIAMAGSVALVGARLVAGRGAALGAALVFCGIRGAFALLVGPGLGETVPHFPLFLAEAALVEVAALALGTGRPYRFGLASGALIGSIGVLAELGWSHLWMPIAWPASMLGEAIGFALPVALAGGVLGAFLGSALKLRAELVATPAAVGSALASLVVIGSVAAVLLQTEVPRATAEVELRELSPGPSRTVEATVTLEPASAAEDADWLGVMAWQGQERLFLDPLERGADGRWRSNRPIPVHDSWKAAIRLQNGTRQGAVPLYMPADPAIPVAGVPAEERMTREFASNPDFFQRERKQDVPGWLWAAGIFVVVALWAALLVLLGWGLVRISGGRRIAGWHRRSHGSHGGASVGPGRRAPAPQPQRWRPSP